MLTVLQKKTAEAIVNVFETGKPESNYGQVTLLKGDSGHLTYGRSQTTLASGNLSLLLNAYCESPEAAYATEFRPYLERVAKCDTALDTDSAFRNLLEEAGNDPIMQEVQDAFFDRVYWAPSVQEAGATGLSSALGTNVVYDSWIHGSWRRLRDQTTATYGAPDAIGESNWIKEYVAVRQDWLATNPNPLLHRTVYRMESFQQLMKEGKWDLALPITIRGVVIDETVLSQTPSIRVSAHDDKERILRLQTPFLQGSDVQAVQQILMAQGLLTQVDSIYGPITEEAVKKFQQQHGLKPDGIVGPATRSALNL